MKVKSLGGTSTRRSTFWGNPTSAILQGDAGSPNLALRITTRQRFDVSSKLRPLKAIFLGMLAACCLPVAAQAEIVSNNQGDQVSDISQSKYAEQDFDYNSFSVNYDETALEPLQQSLGSHEEVAQRTRRTRSFRSDRGLYFGGNLGLFFPKGSDVSFGGSAFAGYKLYQNLGVDGEFILAFGGDFNVFAFMANPRLEFDLTGSRLTAFFSPGIGLGIIDPDQGDSDTDISFQLKSGLTIPVGNNKAFGQFRFFSQKDSPDIYSLEAGMIF